ncbi:hypothetical protein VP1G_08642 [Cytospora mali]|uniref:Uncharacterized protein n=1 Tax=Cytospora mali TaxID=578113 RepID=A0A194VC40_CYTMA|nr:hypothetical protein VP1G_08642 [Valsa mali var. pyri (nom. inval.)]
MTNLGGIGLSAVSARNENVLALASINFDFSLVKLEAPKEFQQLGRSLSSWRRTTAETGTAHRTARKLGALFEQVAVLPDQLYAAYGRRVSEISASEDVNPQGTRKHGVFKGQVGADATSIWAAATSGKTAMAVNLLACMLARWWPASEAIAILSELVETRKKQIQDELNGSEPSHIAPLAASKQEISHKELAEWDASARAWISIADKAKVIQHTNMEEILQAGNLPVDNNPAVYTSVMRSWNTVMSTMNSLIQGMPHSVHDGAVLLAISAWHIYPDIEVFGPKAKYYASNDTLIQQGGRLTIGLENPNPESARGVYWSLHLTRLKYYGDPVEVTRRSTDVSKVSFEDFTLVVLGSLFGSWAGKSFNPNLDLMNAAQLVIKVWEIVESSAYEDDFARQFVKFADNWMQVLVSAARMLTEASVDELPRAKRLVLMGFRRGRNLLGRVNGQSQPFFGLLDPLTTMPLFDNANAKVEALRKLAELRGLGKVRTLISYMTDDTNYMEYTTAVPVNRPVPKRSPEGKEKAASGHVRWISAQSVKPKRCYCPEGCTTNLCPCYKAGVSCDSLCHLQTAKVTCTNTKSGNLRKRSIESQGEVCMEYKDQDIESIPESQTISWYNPPKCLDLGAFTEASFIDDNSGDNIDHESAAHPDSSDDVLSWEEEVIDFDRWNMDRTRRFNCIVGKIEEVALLVLQDEDGNYPPADMASPTLSVTETLSILELVPINATKLLHHLIGFFQPPDDKRTGDNWPGPFLSSMKILGAASRIYKLLPGALVALRLLEGSIPSFKWVPRCLRPYPPSWNSLLKSIFSSFSLSRSEALACVSTFDTGTLNISPAELKDVLAISSGNSIYAPSTILSDPHEGCKEFELTCIVGNVGQAGVTMLTTPWEPRIVKPGYDSWQVINHVPFDLTCEDYFSLTSLHLSFTGYEQPVVSSVTHGARDVEARYMEALVSVYNGSKWVADLDIITALEDGRLERLDLP